MAVAPVDISDIRRYVMMISVAFNRYGSISVRMNRENPEGVIGKFTLFTCFHFVHIRFISFHRSSV